MSPCRRAGPGLAWTSRNVSAVGLVTELSQLRAVGFLPEIRDGRLLVFPPARHGESSVVTEPLQFTPRSPPLPQTLQRAKPQKRMK